MRLSRNSEYKPLLFWFSLFALCWMTLLLYAGGFTTSIEAGMAFLDWPLSNGSLNPEGWTQSADQLAEHSHRLLGMKMGLLSIALWVLCLLFESRRSVRRVAALLVGIIVLQGLIGGLRVLLDQQNLETDGNAIAQVFLILHAVGAQVTLCTMVTLVVWLSKTWIEGSSHTSGALEAPLRWWSGLALGALGVQLLLGAFLRHFKATGVFGDNFPLLTDAWVGLASLIPSVWHLQSAVHFFHRVWAMVVCIALLRFFGLAWSSCARQRCRRFWLIMGTVLLSLQIYLGALVVWTLRNPYAATLHTLVGAGILAITWGLSLGVHRRVWEKGVTHVS